VKQTSLFDLLTSNMILLSICIRFRSHLRLIPNKAIKKSRDSKKGNIDRGMGQKGKARFSNS
jgi:hypothetical protein